MARQETLCSSVARTPNSICKVMSSNLVMNSDKLFFFMPHSWQHFKFRRSFYQFETGSYFSISLIIHQVKTKKIMTMKELWIPGLNPLTPGAFCQKCIFWTSWRFSGWRSAKLASIKSKRHLQYNMKGWCSCHYMHRVLQHFGSGVHRKQNFETRKWPTSLGFSIFKLLFWPFLFLVFFAFGSSDWPSTGLLAVKKLLRMCHRDRQFLPWSSHV